MLGFLDERARYLIRYAGGFAPELVVRAEGSWLEVESGRRILDLAVEIRDASLRAVLSRAAA